MEWCGGLWDAASTQSGCEDRSLATASLHHLFSKGQVQACHHFITNNLTFHIHEPLQSQRQRAWYVLMVGQHWSAFQNHDVSEYVGFTHSCHFFSKYSIFKERGGCKFMHLFFYLESCARPPNSHHLAQDFAMNQFCSMTWMSESMSLTCLMSTLSCLIHQPSQIWCAMEFYTTMVAFTWMRISWPKSQQLSTNATWVEVCTWSIWTHHGSHTWHVFQLESLPVHGPIFPKVRSKHANMNETVTWQRAMQSSINYLEDLAFERGHERFGRRHSAGGGERVGVVFGSKYSTQKMSLGSPSRCTGAAQQWENGIYLVELIWTYTLDTPTHFPFQVRNVPTASIRFLRICGPLR